jgi:CO dehydrogenase/acetyl-CoA synthase alpha subunit|tara:strand:+ start:1043 stop:1306 length:264 start_codon:yes stop_codon:yes gene_type:complete
MKVKNLLDDIESKSLDELNNLADKIIDNLEKKNLEEFVQEYQELIKLNNFIGKKFQQETKSISKKTKEKIDEILSYGKKTKKIIKKS